MIVSPQIEISARSWISIWLIVLTNPREKTFLKLLQEGDRRIARSFTWLLMSHVGFRIVIAGLFILNEGKVYSGFIQSLVAIIVLSLLTIILETCLLHVIALKFKDQGSIREIFLKFYLPEILSTESVGEGSFRDLLFLYAAIQAPLNIIYMLLYSLPAGECFALLISLYVIFLSILALKSLYGISKGKAFIVVIISSVLAAIPHNFLAATLLRI